MLVLLILNVLEIEALLNPKRIILTQAEREIGKEKRDQRLTCNFHRECELFSIRHSHIWLYQRHSPMQCTLSRLDGPSASTSSGCS